MHKIKQIDYVRVTDDGRLIAFRMQVDVDDFSHAVLRYDLEWREIGTNGNWSRWDVSGES